MPNRLADARSPYLLQHKDNPVDWYPWGDEALQRAKKEDMPIFLSVGYAACHWCHVMEHESFENPEIAALLNENFVCIKVDREERPDIDQIYMNAVQMMTGSGGWPMSVFLTPDRRPFYAGTYWPPAARAGMPGFPQVVTAVADAWQNRRDEVTKFSGEITESLREIAGGPESDASAVPAPAILATAADRLVRVHDTTWGGFGQAPKFPHATDLELLLRQYHRTGDARLINVVTLTLDKMAAGGIYDHLAGGFARYSTDARWLVPHFEKMLYDNAGLARVYLLAFQVTGNERYARVADETLTYLVRDMMDSAGGFHSSEDADSEGEEGKFYVWSPEEIRKVLGDERGTRFAKIYDVTPRGNFEGHSILNLPHSVADVAEAEGWDRRQIEDQLAEDRERLRLHRETRVRPGRDDKVLTSWNGLAIEALAVASRVLQRPDYADAAQRAAEFVWNTMRSSDGRLLHAYRDGAAHLPAYLDDYAYTIEALVVLYEATGNVQWIERAQLLAGQMVEHFEDGDAGGFFYTADDAEPLITRLKDWHDNSIPSGSGSAAHALLRLGRLTNDQRWIEAGERTLIAGAAVIEQQSAAAARLLAAVDLWHHLDRQVVVAAPTTSEAQPLINAYFASYRPHTTWALVVGDAPNDGPLADLVAGKQPVDGRPTLYLCEHYTCEAPVSGEQALQSLAK